MIRRLLLRYVLPIVIAISLVALIGVPSIDRLLTGWFRSDVAQRASLVMTSLEEPLGDLLRRGDTEKAGAYLSRVAGDRRLLGIAVCDSKGERVLQTDLVPPVVLCPQRRDGIRRGRSDQGAIRGYRRVAICLARRREFRDTRCCWSLT